MSHTRNYIEEMIGQRVHLILKNGEEFDGVLGHSSFRNFGFEIRYDANVFEDSTAIGHIKEFVFSDIKKITRITADDLKQEMNDSMQRYGL